MAIYDDEQARLRTLAKLHKLQYKMIQANHEEHLAAYAVLICQISEGPIIKLAWSEMIVYVIDWNAKGMCIILASAKGKSKDLP